ncbi:MAG: DNA translocase FtsK [Bacteroidales bacterium]|nr:DNA translocase FtsK [Bacteroidales bacterium]
MGATVLYDSLKVVAPILMAFLGIVFLVFVHHIRFKGIVEAFKAIKLPEMPKLHLPELKKRIPEAVPLQEEPAPEKGNDKAEIDEEGDDEDQPFGGAAPEVKQPTFTIKNGGDDDDDTPEPFIVHRADSEPGEPSGNVDSPEPDDDGMVLVHRPSDNTNPKPAEAATTKPASQSEPQFSIDDEFERVNARARGMQEAGAIVGTQQQEKTPAADDGVLFTVNNTDTQEPAPAVEPDETPAETTPAEEDDLDDYGKHFGLDEPYDPKLELRDFKLPTADLLEDYEVRNVKVTNDELIANKDKIVETLRNYGIEIVEIAASPGPTVTLYEIKPAPGIRISKIKNLEDDIALSLAALGIRIIAPIPGKGTIGIEVPNAKPQVVSMRTMLTSSAFVDNTKYELPIAFGKTISNEPYVTDLAKMPHLLMAGATGTGKSVGLNAVITSLLYKKHPAELKFVMVDPKKVELSIYNKIERYYLAKMPDSEEPIITDVKKVVRTLNSLCIEMDSRYDLLKQAHVRNLKEYNPKFIARKLNPENGHHYMPYIVLVIDEFADLIMTAGKEVEMPIARLAQLARAVGIHLIIATQRPTTNIITGTIKANFPARVAFRVTSGIDSRTILDCGGANQLIGRGDMLISLAGSELVRIQCALIETEECDRITEFISQQRGYPDAFLLPEYLDENEEPNKDFDPKQKDEFFNDAARLVVASQFGSTSLLQRKLQLGYNRAGRIIDQLEAAGVVGPYNGSKAREVLIKDEVTLEELLRSL